jgi:hypothetical protein
MREIRQSGSEGGAERSSVPTSIRNAAVPAAVPAASSPPHPARRRDAGAPNYPSVLTSFFGAIARKLSSIHARSRSIGTSLTLSKRAVTQPCLPMP